MSIMTNGSKRWKNIRIKVNKVFYKRILKKNGTPIMEEDWDNLIILDACRYDMFEEINIFNGKLEFRISNGASTSEFLKKNFGGGKFKDTVYVSANPQVNLHVPDSFLDIVPVWKDGWCKEFGTVLPETVVEYVQRINEKYPDKRLIVHFLQPHYPFISESSRKRIGNHRGVVIARNLLLGKEEVEVEVPSVWDLLEKGELDKKTVWNAYRDNLEVVLPSVSELITNLRGKTVITSDHGNLLGEIVFPFPVRMYGHPSGIYTKHLVKVPWLIVDNGQRKKITECEKIKTAGDSEESDIEQKLKSLGYLD